MPLDGTKIGVRILADVSVAFRVKQERSVVDSAGIFTLSFGKKFRASTFTLVEQTL